MKIEKRHEKAGANCNTTEKKKNDKKQHHRNKEKKEKGELGKEGNGNITTRQKRSRLHCADGIFTASSTLLSSFFSFFGGFFLFFGDDDDDSPQCRLSS